MKTQTILEKFEAVEITNVSRISEEELDYCTKQQALYLQVLEHYRSIFTVLEKLKTDDEEFLKSVANTNDYYSHEIAYHYYDGYGIDANKEDFAKKQVGRIHERFISTIIDYFNKRYGTSIERPSYKKLFEIEEPEFKSEFRGFNGMSGEEKEKYLKQSRIRQRAHEQAVDEYLYYITYADLDYNAILDHIFINLNGSTFIERAEEEIRGNSRGASNRGGKPCYEVKNKKVSINILCPRKGWRDEYEIALDSSGYKAILRALTYFDSGKKITDIYVRWTQFIAYSKSESDGIFDTHDAGNSKVLTFRYYKNGKFEVGFDSRLSAKQFAKVYLFSETAGGEEE